MISPNPTVAFLLLILTFNGCSFLMCGDRGIEQTWTMGHGVKCSGDVMCENKWVHPLCCCNAKICKECK